MNVFKQFDIFGISKKSVYLSLTFLKTYSNIKQHELKVNLLINDIQNRLGIMTNGCLEHLKVFSRVVP